MKNISVKSVKILLSQDLENIFMKMVKFIKVILKQMIKIKVSKMEMGFINFVEMNIFKDNSKIVKLKVLEFNSGKKDLIIKDGGKTVFSMDMVNIIIVMVMFLKEIMIMI